MKKEILVTNDDSIHSPGLRLLVEIASKFGNVKVVAPNSPQSGMGHAVTVNTNLRVLKSDVFSDLENVTTYISSGTPVDCVKWAMYQIFSTKKPDLILSGINHGRNDAVTVLYSGTMSAAMEGAIEDIPSIGFSFGAHSWKADMKPFEKYITEIIHQAFQNDFPTHTCLNVNIPDLPIEKIKGVRVCRQGVASWENLFVERLDPLGLPYYWLAGNFISQETPEKQKESDCFRLENGYITVVPIQCDLTNYAVLDAMKKWNWPQEN